VRSRRILLLVASGLFLAFLLARAGLVREITSRVEILRRFGGEDARIRRMAGTSAAYDRRFFEFLERARLAVPPESRGLALYAPGIPEWGGRYLAIYHLAPLPVAVDPERVPPAWLAVVYGAEPPTGWRVLRELPGGALLTPQ